MDETPKDITKPKDKYRQIEELTPKQIQQQHDRETEIWAEAWLNALDHVQNQDNPSPLFNNTLPTLIELMRDSLNYNPQTEDSQPDTIENLRHQAIALDHAFRRLLHGADTLYKNSNKADCDPMKYAAAFKAQDQYRRTVKTLHTIKMAENATKKVNKWRSKTPNKNT